MPDIARKAGSQGRMKWGATGALVPGPPVQRTPRAETYLFQTKYSFEQFSWFRSDTRMQLYHYIPMLRLVSGAPTATDFSTSLTVC